MRRGLLIGLTALAGAGCSQSVQEQEPDVFGASVQAQIIEAVDNGVIRQRTIYAHHFDDETARLNRLGRRDLGVLGGYFAQHGGTINVRRGTASSELYAARCDAVISALAESGVESGRLVVADDLPGGDGMNAIQVLVILEREASDQGAGTSYGTQGLDGLRMPQSR